MAIEIEMHQSLSTIYLRKSPSNVPTTESNDFTDIEHGDYTGIDDDDIAAGMSFVLEAPTYASTSEALKYAFQSALQAAMKVTTVDDKPKSLAEALSQPKDEADKWYQAALQELAAL